MGNPFLWKITANWVEGHHRLVWFIASKYYKKNIFDKGDIEAEALIVAFEVFCLLRKKNLLHLMDQYFSTVFALRLCKLSLLADRQDLPIENLPMKNRPSPLPAREDSFDHNIIEQALERLTSRQREVTTWVLAQPYPVGTADIGEHFGIRPRSVRSLLQRILTRLEENGSQRICKGVPSPA